MGLTRGSLILPRMNAHRMVIIASALTTAVAAALATVLTAFGGQALPRAVRHDLGGASGTALVITGNVNAGQGAQYASQLPGMISAALAGTPFAFYHAYWSDPLGFVPGSRPAQPASAGNQPIAEAAVLGGITGHAALISGHWPGAPASGAAIPAAMPAAAAALLHVTDGDTLRMKDRISGQYVRFVVTGLYRPRQVSSEYWNLNEVAPTGSSTASGFSTYGPLTVQAGAFAGPAGQAGPLAVYAGSWLAQPETASVPADELGTVAGQVDALRQALANAVQLPDLDLTTSLPTVLNGTASNLDVARSLLDISAVLLFLLAAAALLAVARLLAGQREGESAMLTARGASRGQLVRLTAAEAIPLCLLSSAAGGVAGVLLAGLLPGTGSAGADWPALAAAAAVWQISRQPIRQGGAALLIVLAVATGTLALAQRQSWMRSGHDQAAFASGADVRVETGQPLSAAQAAALAGLPGVRHVMPVATFVGTAAGTHTLAVDSAQAANIRCRPCRSRRCWPSPWPPRRWPAPGSA